MPGQWRPRPEPADPAQDVREQRPRHCHLGRLENPRRCGHLDNPALACSRAPRCARDYQGRISGPLLDRIDLHVEVPALRPTELSEPMPGEARAQVAARVAKARDIQAERLAAHSARGEDPASAIAALRTNAETDGALLDAIATRIPPAASCCCERPSACT